jgi:hypothetical protein
MQKISQKGNPWRFKTVSSNTVVKKEKEEKPARSSLIIQRTESMSKRI